MAQSFRAALEFLHVDLRAVFGDRLRSLLACGPHARPDYTSPGTRTPRDRNGINTLALVDNVTLDDLSACASRVDGWRGKGLATPLLLGADEFRRSLDAFPLEYGDIIAHHVIIAGSNPFEDLEVRGEDLRRACEVQAKSHLIHLREGYIDTRARPAAVAALVVASAAPFLALLANIARLESNATGVPDMHARYAEEAIGLAAGVVRRLIDIGRGGSIASTDAVAFYAQYLEAAEKLCRYVDGWSAPRP